jgi:hypothetical protein
VSKYYYQQSTEDFYAQILASITFKDIDLVADKMWSNGLPFSFIVYTLFEYDNDEETFSAEEYRQHYDPHGYIYTKGEFIANQTFSLELSNRSLRYNYDTLYGESGPTAELLELAYEGVYYQFDIRTLTLILQHRQIPTETIKNIILYEYTMTLEFFKYNPITYYVYSVNYEFELFNEETHFDTIISDFNVKTIGELPWVENNQEFVDKIYQKAEEGQEAVFKFIHELR